jgi:hypothetical protein
MVRRGFLKQLVQHGVLLGMKGLQPLSAGRRIDHLIPPNSNICNVREHPGCRRQPMIVIGHASRYLPSCHDSEDTRLNTVEAPLEQLFGTYGPSVLDCPELTRPAPWLKANNI